MIKYCVFNDVYNKGECLVSIKYNFSQVKDKKQMINSSEENVYSVAYVKTWWNWFVEIKRGKCINNDMEDLEREESWSGPIR